MFQRFPLMVREGDKSEHFNPTTYAYGYPYPYPYPRLGLPGKEPGRTSR